MACSRWYGGITLRVECLMKSTTNQLTGSRCERNLDPGNAENMMSS
jgi:hypothetical protein